MGPEQEMDTMLSPLKDAYSSVGYRYRTLYSYFVSRVQKNLHIGLSLDPGHADFVVRCESNPAIYSCCNILWVDSWSAAGMQTVPRMLLKLALASPIPPNPLPLPGESERKTGRGACQSVLEGLTRRTGTRWQRRCRTRRCSICIGCTTRVS